MNNNKVRNNQQLVEIIVNGLASPGNPTQRIQLQDQPYLRNTFAWQLETFVAEDIAKSPQGNNLVTAAQLATAYLTLYVNDSTPGNEASLGEYIQLQPMPLFHNLQNSTPTTFERKPYYLAGQRIQWDKCYITLNAPLNNTSNLSFLLNVNFTFDPSVSR